MTEAVKDIAQEIRDNKPTDVHSDLYKAVMDMLEYSPDALMAALNQLVDHKAQGSIFLAMGDSHRSRATWPRTTTMCSGCPTTLWGWGGMLACL
jgi:TPP-dependent indolepyruvate ferredoxin oxidoreductase alpha subunit